MSYSLHMHIITVVGSVSPGMLFCREDKLITLLP